MTRLVAGNKTVECKLIIFDKDGTLIDQYSALLELAKARGESIRKSVGKRAAELWEKCVGVDLKKGRIDPYGPLAVAPRREEVLVATAAFYMNGIQWNEAKETAQKAYDSADESMKPPYGSVLLKGVAKTLEQLRRRKLKLAIASTDIHNRSVEASKALKIASCFDVIVGSDDVMNGKPSPDMIVEILNKTGCRTREAVMVGDSVSDMLMGRNAKVKACIGVLTGSTKKGELERLADVVVPSVCDLRAL